MLTLYAHFMLVTDKHHPVRRISETLYGKEIDGRYYKRMVAQVHAIDGDKSAFQIQRMFLELPDFNTTYGRNANHVSVFCGFYRVYSSEKTQIAGIFRMQIKLE